MGTAFLCTPEAIYPQKFKNRLLTAKGSDTVRSTVWDRVRGDLGFGAGVDGRALRNKLVTGEEGRVEDGELKSKYDEQVKRGDQGDWKAIWAGKSSARRRMMPATADSDHHTFSPFVSHLIRRYWSRNARRDLLG